MCASSAEEESIRNCQGMITYLRLQLLVQRLPVRLAEGLHHHLDLHLLLSPANAEERPGDVYTIQRTLLFQTACAKTKNGGGEARVLSDRTVLLETWANRRKTNQFFSSPRNFISTLISQRTQFFMVNRAHPILAGRWLRF